MLWDQRRFQLFFRFYFWKLLCYAGCRSRSTLNNIYDRSMLHTPDNQCDQPYPPPTPPSTAPSVIWVNWSAFAQFLTNFQPTLFQTFTACSYLEKCYNDSEVDLLMVILIMIPRIAATHSPDTYILPLLSLFTLILTSISPPKFRYQPHPLHHEFN